MKNSNKFILWFDELGINDVPLVGGKNASLGEMYRNLTKKGVKIPNGFAVTAYAYKYFLKKAGIENRLKEILNKLDTSNMKNLADKGYAVREVIRNAEFPKELKKVIVEAYHKLSMEYGKDTDVAVRSSATAEDLPDASFAGQQETYLNIRGKSMLLKACKQCFASLFTNRAISYRVDKHFDHLKVYLSIGVQKMIRSDLATAGVMFSIDTETGFKDVVFLTASYGLGENVVQGAVNPDEYYIFKPTLKQGKKPILSKAVGEKKIKMVYTLNEEKPTKNVSVPKEQRGKFALTDDEITTLAKWACIIEDHYSKKAGHFKPMDIEWAKDGKSKELFIVQARPETVQSQKDTNILEDYMLKKKGDIIVTGKSVGSKIGQGKVNIILNVHDINKFKKGEVLVTDMTDPDWEPVMKIASAIVTNRGGRTCFTGDTKLLTNKGFIKFKDVIENYEDLYVPSLNKKTMKIEWRKVLTAMKRKAEVVEVNISQTGRMRGNNLRLTKDHKILTYKNAELISKEIQEVINQENMVLLAQKIPSLNEASEKDKKLAYLLGAICTDGNIYLSRTHGEVQFIQKPTKEKQEFIAEVQDCFGKVFNKIPKTFVKKESSGTIRGKQFKGNANAYRCYSKQIAEQMTKYTQNLTQTLLRSEEQLVYHFLAGVIDGDGTFNQKTNRINIYCSKEPLLQAIIISCLRLGFLPQVTRNRTIYNVQIVEKINQILSYTKRVKGLSQRKRQGTRFFSAKQLIGNKIEELNYEGKLKGYVDKNLLIDANKINKKILPLASREVKQKLQKILDSDTRMQRVNLNRELGEEEVYNITVEGNHNYVVFTDRYTPILVNNCHAAIVSRELGVPCIVGTLEGTKKIKNRQSVTASCAEGEVGFVYKGLIPFEIKKINLKELKKPKTHIMMNLGNPERALELSFIPNDGVGLAREEFIINEYIKIHPKALINFNKIKDHKIKKKIEELTNGYKNKKEFFVEKLAEGVATIVAAFYPKPVIVRMSDFKSNEYANLIGGKDFEPVENNPMIGWRGASRYYSDNYREAFGLECKALKKVRNEMGLTNLKIMIPFCRTVEEGKLVQKEMAKYGLERGKNKLEIYVMCEIPSNVLLADEFSKIFDGFSIGTNDLTQLTLGLDRDSALVSHIYDERNLAVKKIVALAILKAKKNNRHIGICGQAPSDYPEFAQFLVSCGIDSISLNPDTVIKTTLAILEMEKKLKR